MTLTVSLLDEPLTRPVLDGTALPDGLALTASIAASVDANSRAMQVLAFDVAEMSFATYLRARLVEGAPLVALPVFTGRRFVQPLMGTHDASPVQGIEDLAGHRVAVPQYWMTSSVWHRAVLQDHYGVPASEMSWITTGEERFAMEPAGVRVERCADGRSAADLVRAGDADVVLAPRPPADGLRQLFSDPVAEQLHYYAATGILPIMHLVVVRQTVLNERPGDVAALWQGLVAARDMSRPGPPVPGVPEAAAAEAFDADPWTYGVEANAAALSALIASAHRDGMVPYVPDPSDVFIPASVMS